MLICLLALLAGALLPLWAPVVQFAVGLVAVASGGAVLALVLGTPFGTVAVWTAALYCSAQVGYALGMMAIVAYCSRRASAGASPRAFLRSWHQPFMK